MTTPLRPVARSCGPLPIRAVVRPPRPARKARSCWPSRSAIIPPRTSSCTGIGFASPGRLSTTTIPTPPASFTRALLSAKVQVPRETSAIAPFSEPARSGVGPPSRFPGGPQRSRGTGWPFVPTSVPTSTSCWSEFAQAAGVFGPAVRTNGIRVSGSGVPGAVTDRAGAKTCEFESAATEIASGALPGEPAEPTP